MEFTAPSTPDGRIRRAPIGFLYHSKSLYATNGLRRLDNEPLRRWIYERVAAINRRTRRAADHLASEQLAEHLAAAQAALEWAEKHPAKAGAYRDLWAKHARDLHAAITRRTP